MSKSKEWIEEALDILEHVIDKKFSPDIYFTGRYKYKDNILPYLLETNAIKRNKNSYSKGNKWIEVSNELRLSLTQEKQTEILTEQSKISSSQTKVLKLYTIFTFIMALAMILQIVKITVTINTYEQYIGGQILLILIITGFVWFLSFIWKMK